LAKFQQKPNEFLSATTTTIVTEQITPDDTIKSNHPTLVVTYSWMTPARPVRASMLVLTEMEFVLAARVLGASSWRIATVHLLPNAMAPILVAVTLAVGRGILYESVLSFLGLGIQPPMPTWGNMLTNAQESLWKAPWLAVFPGALILLTVVSVNFVGDGLRDALDPRARR
jgi:peptide/nickel transport system permease protein